MDTDIRDELDRSFGAGPPIDDLDLLLDRGRAAVRRRRLAGAASIALAAGVVVGIALVSTGGPGTTTSPDPAGTASATPTSAPVVPDAIEPDVVPIIRDDRREDGPRSLNQPVVSLEADGFVHAQPDVEILHAVADPLDRPDISRSVALQYVYRGETHWFFGAIQGDGMIFSTSTPALADLPFERWVAASAPARRLDHDRWPGRDGADLVEFSGDTERLRAMGSATILEQRPHPALPDSFAGARDASAVAMVELQGERWYVLARRSPGSPPQYIAVPAEDGGATLDDFLTMARDRYAEGGGGLL